MQSLRRRKRVIERRIDVFFSLATTARYASGFASSQRNGGVSAIVVSTYCYVVKV
jgi:hypothetical protein